MKLSLVSVVALSLALAAPIIHAQAPDAKIQSLLSDVAKAYRELTDFSATMESKQTSGSTERKTTTQLTFQRPGKLRAEVSNGSIQKHIVADGATIYTDSSADQTRYTTQPLSKFDDAVTALARGGGTGVGLLPILLTSPNAEQRIIPGTPTSTKRLPDESVSGEACDVIEAVLAGPAGSNRYQFAFGKKDHLLRRLSIETSSASSKNTMVETYTGITLRPTLADTTFTYTPAAGAVAMDAPKEPEMFDSRLKVGAAPFPIIGKDLAGKAASLNDYKGKVLLLDFWATWCGPCVAELPNVIAAYSKYHTKGFEILGISLDQADARPKLEKFIADQKMPWRQVYDGKFWEAANAEAYGVRSIPFTLLIGRDGKIAAVGARGPALAPAIEAALGKN